MKTKEQNNPASEWDARYKKEICGRLLELRKDGTVQIGANNLFHIVRPPTGRGAPQGGNLRWQVAQRFLAITKKLPKKQRAQIDFAQNLS